MSEAVKVLLDIALTAAANGMAESTTVSDLLKGAHAAGHEITDADLAAYIVSGSEALAALHAVNVARKG